MTGRQRFTSPLATGSGQARGIGLLQALTPLLSACGSSASTPKDKATPAEGQNRVSEVSQPRTTETDQVKIASVPQDPQQEEGEDDREQEGTDVTVARVVDGDTVQISPAVEGKNKVRLIGVDTPETKGPQRGVQPYGEEASSFTTSELGGKM